MVFSEVVGTLSFLQPQADDDMADRLNYYYTTTFLLVTSVLISLKMYGGRPIECWMPAEYQSSWQEYTEIYCFSMNTYYAPFTAGIPSDYEDRKRNMISYYQWSPFFLVICAFLFYSPCLIWRVLYTKSGIRINEIIAFANDRSNIQPKSREANMKGMSAHLSSVFRHRFRFGHGHLHPYHHRFLRVLNLRFYEAYLTFLYMGIKLLFLSNVCMQMFLMNWFLQTSNYRYYGLGVLQDLLDGRPWSDSGNFPRVTYCDMDIRILGNVQKHTVQCVLVINIFIEKIFVLLWIWYSLLVVVTIFSFINWLMSSLPFEARKRFIARRLELADVEFRQKNFEGELDEFVRDYIKMDGVFMLRMLTIHAGILVCTEVVDAMWEDFIANRLQLPTAATESPLAVSTPPKPPPTVICFNAPKASYAAAGGGAECATAKTTASDPTIYRRKTSVLVPLLSAVQEQCHKTELSQNLPRHSATYTAASGATLAVASRQILVPPRRDQFLLKTPNPSEYHSEQRQALRHLTVSSDNKPSNVAAPLVPKYHQFSMMSKCRQRHLAPASYGKIGCRSRRRTSSSNGQGGIVPSWSAMFGSAMAPFQNRSFSLNSAVAQQLPSEIPEVSSCGEEASLVELEEGESSSCVTNQRPTNDEKKESNETDGDDEANVPRCSTSKWHGECAKK
ncbi:hypothetical protein niasHS_005192 [Heterodera schachtii]|uniref:Innexin n=1 Tax=Heterodera schachtii TaxID=97005 RepID=A0ABD2JRP2_HETSC